MASIGDHFVDVLIDAGIEFVFGMPGGGTPALWDGMVGKEDRIRAILARHEGGASCMADTYGRLTGKPGVLMGQGLWIGSSGVGIVEAFLAGVPMVVICDVSDYNNLSQFGPYQNSTGEYGAVDLLNIMKGMTKFTTYATNASELIHGTRLAIKHAVTGRPGPTCVLMRMAVAGVTHLEPEDIRPRLYPFKGYLNTSLPCISAKDADRVADMLIQAKHPVMITGTGIHRSGAYEEVQALAELLGMPVATSYMGKSAIRETHDLSVGTMGIIGQESANETIMKGDVILAVGTCLAPENTKMLSPKFINPERQKIIQIDIEALNTGWAYPVAMGIQSDARLALQEIIGCIRKKPVVPDVQQRIDDLKQQKIEAAFFSDPAMLSNDVPIAPERVVRELNDLIGDEDRVVLDAGNNRMWMSHYFKTKKAGQIIAAGGAAPVGYGLGATLAAQLVSPEKRVVGVCGDGGMMMHLYVMEMAKEYKLPVTYVVMNNACLGNLMDYQAPGRQIATTYNSVNFARIARGFGIEGIRVDDPANIKETLKKALELNEPAVVDIAIDDYSHFKLRR